jgi:DTW domain-containing protein YfiP
MNKNYCEECGEMVNDCVCHLITRVEYEEKDFKWEYAHELISVKNTQFKRILPLSD